MPEAKGVEHVNAHVLRNRIMNCQIEYKGYLGVRPSLDILRPRGTSAPATAGTE